MAFKIRHFIATLGDRKFGFYLLLAFCFNLAMGSLIMNANSDIYPPFFSLEFDLFFHKFKFVHSWFYTLFAFSVILCFNLFFSTLDLTLELFKSKLKRSYRIAVILIHTSILLAFIAHYVEGQYSQEKHLTVFKNYVTVNLNKKVKLLNVKNIYHPDRTKKDSIVSLRVLSHNSDESDHVISYNNPLRWNFRIDHLLIEGTIKRPALFILQGSDNSQLRLPLHKETTFKNIKITVTDVKSIENSYLLINLQILEKNKIRNERLMLGENHNKVFIEIDKVKYHLSNFENDDAVILKYKHNPGLLVMVLSVGCIFMGLVLLVIYRLRLPSLKNIY